MARLQQKNFFKRPTAAATDRSHRQNRTEQQKIRYRKSVTDTPLSRSFPIADVQHIHIPFPSHTFTNETQLQIRMIMQASSEKVDTEYSERLLTLLQIESNLSNGFRKTINEKARKFLQDLIPDASLFLQEGLDTEKQSENDVKTLVRAVPDVLFHEDARGDFPYWDALWSSKYIFRLNLKAAPLVPIIMEEGNRLNVDVRGGFLRKCVPGMLCHWSSRSDEDASACLAIMHRLRQLNVFRKEDIKDFDLLKDCCIAGGGKMSSLKLYHYLVQWDPEGLRDWRDRHGLSLIHEIIRVSMPPATGYIELTMVLLAGLMYHSAHLGLIYDKNPHGQTAWDEGCERFGAYEMWQIVERCIKDTRRDELLVVANKDNQESPAISFSPFFEAAVSDEITKKVDIVYHLLKKDPSEWIGFQSFEHLECQTTNNKL